MSPERASSFHLVWRFPRDSQATPLVEVSAALEVLSPPRVPAVYFWALQVDFFNRQGVWGGGHTGLQWNPRYPGGTAVNWGGYATPELGGAVLEGTVSELPGFADDPHTLSYSWLPGREYRFRVHRSAEMLGAWRAEVTDIRKEETTVIRDLLPIGSRDRGIFGRLLLRRRERSGEAVEGGYLARPIVWSEVFAECDAPSVSIRWSDLRALGEDGAVLRPEVVAVNYQSAAEGGCPNTSMSVDPMGLLQITNTPRVVGQGTLLVPPDPRR